MAWRVVTENKYELAETWKGDSTKIEFQFPFPNIPGVEDLKALTTSLKYMMGLHTVAVSWILRRYLHYKIETDDGHIIQHGRVTMIFAGKQSEIEGELRDAGVEGVRGIQRVGTPPLLALFLLGVLVIIGIAIGVVTYKITHLGGAAAWAAGIGLFALVGGLGFAWIYLNRRGSG